MLDWGPLTGIANAEELSEHNRMLAPETRPMARGNAEKKIMTDGYVAWNSVKTRSTLGEKMTVKTS